MWIIHNSKAVHQMTSGFNRKKMCSNIRTYDFSTLYTNIPHNKLKKRLAQVIKEAFASSKKTRISVYARHANWVEKPRKGTFSVDCSGMIRLLNWLIDNIYVTFGDKVFRQKIGIPMGTDCAPFLANLFLYSYEKEWIDKQRKAKNWHILKSFKGCCRYIDDLLLMNNFDLMKKYMKDIYPKELSLVPDDSDGSRTPFLDLDLVSKDLSLR